MRAGEGRRFDNGCMDRRLGGWGRGRGFGFPTNTHQTHTHTHTHTFVCFRSQIHDQIDACAPTDTRLFGGALRRSHSFLFCRWPPQRHSLLLYPLAIRFGFQAPDHLIIPAGFGGVALSMRFRYGSGHKDNFPWVLIQACAAIVLVLVLVLVLFFDVGCGDTANR